MNTPPKKVNCCFCFVGYIKSIWGRLCVCVWGGGVFPYIKVEKTLPLLIQGAKPTCIAVSFHLFNIVLTRFTMGGNVPLYIDFFPWNIIWDRHALEGGWCTYSLLGVLGTLQFPHPHTYWFPPARHRNPKGFFYALSVFNVYKMIFILFLFIAFAMNCRGVPLQFEVWFSCVIDGTLRLRISRNCTASSKSLISSSSNSFQIVIIKFFSNRQF